MKISKIERLKKTGALALVAMMIVLSMSTTSFASSPQSASNEEIGIEVFNPGGFGVKGTRAYIQDTPVYVGGGKLWVT